MNQFFLSLGSNCGSRIKYINQALRYLQKQGQITDSSFMYETDPMYMINQQKFLNCVLKFESSMKPLQALQFFQDIERKCGRINKQILNGPRNLDIDILFYNKDDVFDSQDLQIPHPRIQEREFVLKPMMDINPNFYHPKLNQSIKQLYNHLNEHKIKQVLPIETQMGEKILPLDKCLSMGIVNLSQDSFYDNFAKFKDENEIVRQVLEFLKGFDIIDVGGESTKPQSLQIDADNEIQRIQFVVHELRKHNKEVILSLDTRKFEVASRFIQDIDIINDVSGGEFSSQMYNLVATHLKPYVLMHCRGSPQNMHNMNQYDNIIDDIIENLNQKIKLAQKAGVPKWNIIIDPGIGFAKNAQQNIQIIQNLQLFTKLGFPTLVGFSNKKFLQSYFGIQNLQQANSTMTAICIQKGANIIRIHNKEIINSINLLNFIYNNQN